MRDFLFAVSAVGSTENAVCKVCGTAKGMRHRKVCAELLHS